MFFTVMCVFAFLFVPGQSALDDDNDKFQFRLDKFEHNIYEGNHLKSIVVNHAVSCMYETQENYTVLFFTAMFCLLPSEKASSA